MQAFEIIRTDINKRVVPAMKYSSEEEAVGQYVSALMLAGIVKMNSSGLGVEKVGNAYRLSNGWIVEARAA